MLTAAACFVIPNEIRAWRKALSLAAATTIGGLFVLAIALVGVMHLVMPFLLPTGPWWAVLLVALPLAGVTTATAFLLRINRPLILAFLRQVGVALGAPQ